MPAETARKVAKDMKIAIFGTPSCIQKMKGSKSSVNYTKLYISLKRVVIYNNKTSDIYYDSLNR